MSKKPAKWFVRRATDRAILAVDGKWYDCVAGVERIKFYSSAGRALKYGFKGCKGKHTLGDLYSVGTAYAVYPGDTVDRDGKIVRAESVIPIVTFLPFDGKNCVLTSR